MQHPPIRKVAIHITCLHLQLTSQAITIRSVLLKRSQTGLRAHAGAKEQNERHNHHEFHGNHIVKCDWKNPVIPKIDSCIHVTMTE